MNVLRVYGRRRNEERREGVDQKCSAADSRLLTVGYIFDIYLIPHPYPFPSPLFPFSPLSLQRLSLSA
jgi:hypothetical protein